MGVLTHASAGRLYNPSGCYAHSNEGAQQGDPLGPTFFSAGIQDIITHLHSTLKLDHCIYYLDDGMVAGTVDALASYLKAAIQHFAAA